MGGGEKERARGHSGRTEMRSEMGELGNRRSGGEHFSEGWGINYVCLSIIAE